MKITVFTSNQPRHIALIESLSKIADTVYAIQECNTIFPGQVDDFFRKSPVMQDYFSRVIHAENEVFGTARFLPANVRSLSIKMGDLNRVPMESLTDALAADRFVVFGATYIKSSLCDALVDARAQHPHGRLPLLSRQQHEFLGDVRPPARPGRCDNPPAFTRTGFGADAVSRSAAN